MIAGTVITRHRATILARLPALSALASVFFFVIAIAYLHRELTDVSWRAVMINVRGHMPWRVVVACCLAAAGYTVLTAYDSLALRYIRHPLHYGRTALASFMAFAVGHNVGFAALSAGSIRYRMYTAMGLSASEIFRIVAFCSVTFAIGAIFLLGLSLLALNRELTALSLISRHAALPAGLLLVAFASSYVLSPLIRTRPLQAGGWRIEIPPLRITLLQLLVSSMELSLAAGTLFVLLEPSVEIGFSTFIGIYLIAVTAGIASSLPGGIGVFEAVLMSALPDVDRGVLLSTIVVYRLIYYAAPLALAVGLLGLSEVKLSRKRFARIRDVFSRGLAPVAPFIFGVIVFLAGIVLIVTGSMPAVASRMRVLGELIPQHLLESSHLAASVLGLCLLILARGLYRRSHEAYRLTLIALVAASVACLARGLDYEEAMLLGAVAGLLGLAGNQFYRIGYVSEHLSARWTAALAIAVASMIWIGLISYRDVEYSGELFWQFSLDADAPRMLRAAVAVTTAAVGYGVWQAMRPMKPAPQQLTVDVADSIRAIVAAAVEPSANAALIGDKQFLLSDDRAAFIMYQVHGRSWIAFGDPVGDERRAETLAWRFREICDRHDGIPAFYEVTDSRLALYIDLGLSLWKLGEEARVAVGEFSLDGSARADLRQARNRAARSGAHFSILARQDVVNRLPELRRVSDSWLVSKSTAEKGFSLGSFSEDYMANFNCAIVTISDRVVAFANLWPAPAGHELSIDLMRYGIDAPKGIMDFLLTELIVWARSQNYQWFNLGMAPLSGLETHPLAPMWQRLGSAIFHSAEEYYNFEGLRAYKEKFGPVWRSRYLACSSGLALPRVLYDTTVLIGGNLRSVIAK